VAAALGLVGATEPSDANRRELTVTALALANAADV
jgi:hypothetical protein